MDRNIPKTVVCGVLASLCLAALTAGQESTPPLAIRSIAEVESRSLDGGREIVKLIPAKRVVPGDHVIYTLEVRNAGATVLDNPTVTHAVPEHMRYVADSAVGPGAEVSYSVDGGHHFDRPRISKCRGPMAGRARRSRRTTRTSAGA